MKALLRMRGQSVKKRHIDVFLAMRQLLRKQKYDLKGNFD